MIKIIVNNVMNLYMIKKIYYAKNKKHYVDNVTNIKLLKIKNNNVIFVIQIKISVLNN